MAPTAPVLPVSPPTNNREEGRARAQKGCGQNGGVLGAGRRSSEQVLNADEIEAPEEVQTQWDIRTPDIPTQAEMAEHKTTAMRNTGIGALTVSRDSDENGLTSSPWASASSR